MFLDRVDTASISCSIFKQGNSSSSNNNNRNVGDGSSKTEDVRQVEAAAPAVATAEMEERKLAGSTVVGLQDRDDVVKGQFVGYRRREAKETGDAVKWCVGRCTATRSPNPVAPRTAVTIPSRHYHRRRSDVIAKFEIDDDTTTSNSDDLVTNSDDADDDDDDVSKGCQREEDEERILAATAVAAAATGDGVGNWTFVHRKCFVGSDGIAQRLHDSR